MLAQDEFTSGLWEVQVYGDFGVPQGAFADNIETIGIGFGGEVLRRINGPVMAGVSVHSMRFDNYSIGYFEEFDGELFEYDELTATRIFTAHAAVRFQPEIQSTFKPYMQGGVGWHWMFTNTRIKDVTFDEVVDRFKEADDSSLGFALMAGVQIEPAAFEGFAVDVRFGYHYNASVNYLVYNPTLGDVNSYPIDFFEPKTSAVDILVLNIGVRARF